MQHFKMLIVSSILALALIGQMVFASTADATTNGQWTGDICGPIYGGMTHFNHTCVRFKRIRYTASLCMVTEIQIKGEPADFAASDVTDSYNSSPALSFGSFTLMSASGVSVMAHHGADAMGKHRGGLIYRDYDVKDSLVYGLRLNLNQAKAHLWAWRDVTQSFTARHAC